MQLLTLFPDGFYARPTRLDDAAAVAEQLNACSIADTGSPGTHPDELRSDWQQPSVNLANDSIVVLASDGAIVGHAPVWDSAPHVRPHLSADVHPVYRGRGIGTALCAWGEARAQQAILKAPEGARVAVREFILGADESARRLLDARGFALVRHNLRMLIELEAPPPKPQVPDGLTIRPFVRGQDEEAFVTAMQEGFRDSWGFIETPLEDDLREWKAFMDSTPHFDPELFLLAVDDGEIAGTLCGLSRPGESPEKGWIFGLCVLRPWRRRGLAQALLLHSFGQLYDRGMWRIGLGVDADSLTGATRLYQKVGMRVERRYEMWDKELRPGIESATQSLN
jgi:mycothiol synthase